MPYEFVARSAHKAMFFEGDEDCGVASQKFTDAVLVQGFLGVNMDKI